MPAPCGSPGGSARPQRRLTYPSMRAPRRQGEFGRFRRFVDVDPSLLSERPGCDWWPQCWGPRVHRGLPHLRTEAAVAGGPRVGLRARPRRDRGHRDVHRRASERSSPHAGRALRRQGHLVHQAADPPVRHRRGHHAATLSPFSQVFSELLPLVASSRAEAVGRFDQHRPRRYVFPALTSPASAWPIPVLDAFRGVSPQYRANCLPLRNRGREP